MSAKQIKVPKTEPVRPPKGWRKVLNGWTIRKADIFFYYDGKKLKAGAFAGNPMKSVCPEYGICIRRLPKKRASK